MADLRFAFSGAVEGCFAGKFVRAEGHKIALVAEPLACSRLRLDQLAIRGKYRRRRAAVFEQTARALGQGEFFAGALDRHHQYGSPIVGEDNAGAEANQSAAKAGAETTQPFQSRRAALRQGAGETRDLRRRYMTWLEFPCGNRAGRGRVENCRSRRVCPENAIGIRAPEPDGHGIERVRRQLRLAQIFEMQIGTRHRGVAQITANETLIGLPMSGVHDLPEVSGSKPQ